MEEDKTSETGIDFSFLSSNQEIVEIQQTVLEEYAGKEEKKKAKKHKKDIAEQKELEQLKEFQAMLKGENNDYKIKR